MKKINCNDWVPRNSQYEWLITNPLIAARNYYNFHTYNVGGPARFYHRLAGVVLYSILDEDNYFDEDDWL